MKLSKIELREKIKIRLDLMKTAFFSTILLFATMFIALVSVEDINFKIATGMVLPMLLLLSFQALYYMNKDYNKLMGTFK